MTLKVADEEDDDAADADWDLLHALPAPAAGGLVIAYNAVHVRIPNATDGAHAALL
eukprot:CAMPEP_0171115250 /NCGR_PEP_ID=MMETSP0766_2-20121228/87318_1 /TAXON_ID=439317 /ORGANISM="Gambierdiscus australes, Strain CAWD 149" /LENGTH=55 /DNA_ID=CAMNT_0011577593 /DNA_START=200 /DNA_END=363 /DNA_ORIENTATION=+